MKTKRWSDQQIIEALEAAQGYISVAARRLGCEPSTIYSRMEKSAAIRATKDRFDEIQLDNAEIALQGLIAEKDRWAVGFILKTKGAKRGWVESRNLNIAGQENAPPVRLEFTKTTYARLAEMSDDDDSDE